MMIRLCLLVLALFVAFPAFADTLAAPGIRIVVPSRDIARGEVLSESDLSYQTVAASAAFPGIVTSLDDLKGMETRRVLRAGEAVRRDDVRRPVIVLRGATVTMTFSAPGITLTAMGKAMSEGGVGDLVTVENPTSFRQISAVVTGPGQVSAVSTTMTIGPTAQLSGSGR